MIKYLFTVVTVAFPMCTSHAHHHKWGSICTTLIEFSINAVGVLRQSSNAGNIRSDVRESQKHHYCRQMDINVGVQYCRLF